MPEIKILTESELKQIVHLDMNAVDCIESVFAALSGGSVVMPPILSMAIEKFNGEVDVKTAYIPGVKSFAIKMSPGFFDNPKLGLPSTTGLMVLFSARTGMLESVLLDNGYLTDVRTAAAGAVAARHLANPEAATACIVGAGQQSRLQLEALCLVRPVTFARIWARNHTKGISTAEELSGKLGIKVTFCEDIQRAVSSADVVITTTPSTSPLIRSEWLRPGQHITTVGSDQSHKVELDPNCIGLADLYVPDRRSQTEKLGELHHALKENIVSNDTIFPELGDIVSQKHDGRRTPRDITICDLTGTGAQDTAIATYARERAESTSAGLTLST